MDPELGSHGFELEEFISYYSLLRHFNALSAALRLVEPDSSISSEVLHT